MLYRYKRFDKKYTIEELEDFSFYISSADSFNDFHDVQIGYDSEKALKYLLSNDLFYNASLNYRDKYQLTYMSREELLRDYIDYLVNGFIVSVKQKILICSLTTDNSNPVMWSHYAAKSTGYVVCYQEKDFEQTFGNALISSFLFDVTYNDDPFDITDIFLDSIKSGIENGQLNLDTSFLHFLNAFFHLNGSVCKNNFLTNKRKFWEYEKEKRFIKADLSLNGDSHIKIATIKPTYVILGQKMSFEDKASIINSCFSKNIPIYLEKISYDLTNYGLIISPLAEQDLLDMSILYLETNGILNFDKNS